MKIQSTKSKIQNTRGPAPYPQVRLGGAGFAALFVTVLALVITLSIAMSISLVVFWEQKMLQGSAASVQGYYAAESGIEDALIRLVQDMNLSSPYSFSVENALVTVTISPPDPLTGRRQIDSAGNKQNRFRKVRAFYQLDSTGVSFNYGAQVGVGGMEMRNNSKIVGNVFSNGSVLGQSRNLVTITESVVAATNGNKIEELTVGRDAKAYSCKNVTATGTIRYVSPGGSASGCTAVGGITSQSSEIQPVDFPITATTISQWKADAEAGGVITGNVTISANTTMGPKKITGNLYIDTGKTLTLTGTLWVAGTFDTGTNATVKLDSGYGSYSGIFIVDGNVHVHSNVILQGSGSAGSYLLVLGTSGSLDETNPAIEVKNNVSGAILYASNGLLEVDNGVKLVEVIAYKLLLKPGAAITYESGLANAVFTSGPSGGIRVSGWKEVE